jgi:hypothetical protein
MVVQAEGRLEGDWREAGRRLEEGWKEAEMEAERSVEVTFFSALSKRFLYSTL